jgi:hypothetical protein
MGKTKTRIAVVSCALALLIVTGGAVAQDSPAAAVIRTRVASRETGEPTAPPTPESKPTAASHLKVSYVSGQLSIDALNSTLTEVLAQVESLTGVKFEIPATATNNRLPIVDLGPGTPRQVLALLFDGSNLDYLIQGSSTDPDKIASVLLVLHEKKPRNESSAASVAIRARSPYSRSVGTHSQIEAPSEGNNSPATIQSDKGLVDGQPLVSAQQQQELSNQPVQQSLGSLPAPSNRSGLTTEGAMNPPASMNRQGINQQLQQMYQQRTQMMRLTNPQVAPSTAANPGNH